MLINFIKGIKQCYITSYLTSRKTLDEQEGEAIAILLGLRVINKPLDDHEIQEELRHSQDKGLSKAYIKLFHQPGYLPKIEHYLDNINSFSEEVSFCYCRKLRNKK